MTAILAGTTADFDLPSVIEVSSLGRQTLRLVVLSANDEVVGYAVLKAGRVTDAAAGSLRGQPALRAILDVRGTNRFRLVRDMTEHLGEPVASARDVHHLAAGSRPRHRDARGSAHRRRAQVHQGHAAHRRSVLSRPGRLGSRQYIRRDSLDASIKVPMWVLFAW